MDKQTWALPTAEGEWTTPTESVFRLDTEPRHLGIRSQRVLSVCNTDSLKNPHQNPDFPWFVCAKNKQHTTPQWQDKHLGAPLFYYTAENRRWHQNWYTTKLLKKTPNKSSFNLKSQNLISEQYANKHCLLSKAQRYKHKNCKCDRFSTKI